MTHNCNVRIICTSCFAAASAQSKERAKAEEVGDSEDAGQEGSDNDSDEGLEAAAEQDGLQSEVLRGKNMDVASMDALKKRIEVRLGVHAYPCVVFPIFSVGLYCVRMPELARDYLWYTL